MITETRPGVPPADPFLEAIEAAKAMWVDLVTQGLPMGWEERLDAVLKVYSGSLVAAGWLRIPTVAPTEAELDSAAKRLAKKSQFPRYVDGEGWRHLRTSRHDIDIALAKARIHLIPGQKAQLNELITDCKDLSDALPPRHRAPQ